MTGSRFDLALEAAWDDPFDEFVFDDWGPSTPGKVRERWVRDEEIVLVTTDRLSAFDRILGVVPYKGQILTELAAFWFDELSDLVTSHVRSIPDPNVTIGRRCEVLPVEVIVRGHISGVTSTALWTQYDQGHRRIYGIDFPDGLTKNQRLDEPIITPTTKASDGGHDERITAAEIVADGHVDADVWAAVADTALAIFERGRTIAEQAGLVLVDTKYEFGIADGELVLVDEVHTPDSSRFWRADTLAERLASGDEPDNVDKEMIRLAYAADGYLGQGAPPPPLSRELAFEASRRYIEVFEALTGRAFEPAPYPAAPRIAAALGSLAGAS